MKIPKNSIIGRLACADGKRFLARHKTFLNAWRGQTCWDPNLRWAFNKGPYAIKQSIRRAFKKAHERDLDYYDFTSQLGTDEQIEALGAYLLKPRARKV